MEFSGGSIPACRNGLSGPIQVTTNELLGFKAAAFSNAAVCLVHNYKQQGRLKYIMLAFRKASGGEELLLLVRLGCTAVACFSNSILHLPIQDFENSSLSLFQFLFGSLGPRR